MEGINKLFNEIIKGASEELKSKSSSELVTLAREGNQEALAILGKRVIPMAKSICYTKNCYIYGEAEVEEAFVHALMYGINHYDTAKSKAKFETMFNTYASSTFAQMHQTANTGKNQQMNRAESLDDLQFALPDETKETPEQSVVIDNIISLIDSSNWCPEDISMSYYSLDESYKKYLDKHNAQLQELYHNRWGLSEEEVTEEKVKLDAEFEEKGKLYDERLLSLQKKESIHKKLMKKFIQITTENLHTLSDEELCVELKLIKFASPKLKKAPMSASEEKRLEIEQENIRIATEQRERNKESLKSFLAEYIKNGYSRGLTTKYGIICDKQRLTEITSDIKSLLRYTDCLDVDKYQLAADRNEYNNLVEKAISKRLAAEAKERGKKLAEVQEAYSNGNLKLELKDVLEKIKEAFLHSHPDTQLVFKEAM